MVLLCLLLTVADMVKIKASGTLAVSAQTTWLSGTTSLIQDLRDNQNAAVSATQVSGFTADSTAPTLAAFEVINTNLGTIQLSFSEPVDMATIVYASVTLQSQAAGGSTLALGGGTIVYTDSSTKLQVVITMTATDLQTLKTTAGLAKARASSFVSLLLGAVKDMGGNSLTATSEPRLSHSLTPCSHSSTRSPSTRTRVC